MNVFRDDRKLVILDDPENYFIQSDGVYRAKLRLGSRGIEIQQVFYQFLQSYAVLAKNLNDLFLFFLEVADNLL